MAAASWEFIGQPNVNDLGSRLTQELGSGTWTSLSVAVAYVKMSGVTHVAKPLFDFAQRHSVTAVVGIDQQGSSLEGVQTLWLLLGGAAGDLYALNNPSGSPSPTFHPKLWLFEGPGGALLLCGSGNLTGGGLFTNYEAGLALRMQATDPELAVVKAALTAWTDDTQPEVSRVTASGLQAMHDAGELPSEAATRVAIALARTTRAMVAGLSRGGHAASGLFSGSPTQKAPAPQSMPPLPAAPVTPKAAPRVSGSKSSTPAQPKKRGAKPVPGVSSPVTVSASALVPQHNELLIRVNPRNKTEIYLAQAPLQEDPAFFGWPFLGRTTPRRNNPGQPQPDPLPVADVTVFDATGAVLGRVRDPSLKLWTYSFGLSANDDFRMTLTGGLHKLVPDGSVLRMIRQPPSGVDFELEVYPPGHPQHTALLAGCTETLPGGRRYGWR